MHSGCTLLAKATNSGRVILYLLNVATEHLQKNVAAFFLRSRMKKGEKAALYKSSREMRKEKLHVHVVSNSPHHDAGR